jgi:transposase
MPRRCAASASSTAELYKRRNLIERCNNRIKQWRGIATRYDKLPDRDQAAMTRAQRPYTEINS